MPPERSFTSWRTKKAERRFGDLSTRDMPHSPLSDGSDFNIRHAPFLPFIPESLGKLTNFMINVVLPTGSYFFEFKTDVTKYRPNLFFIAKPVFTILFGHYFTFLGKNVTFVETIVRQLRYFLGVSYTLRKRFFIIPMNTLDTEN
jgi:hypothetical protein